MEKRRKLSAVFLSLRSNRKFFFFGLALLVLNPPLGWLGAAASAWLAWRRADPRYLVWGVIIYGFSWLLLGVGVLFAGPRGLQIAREEKKRLILWIKEKLPPRR